MRPNPGAAAPLKLFVIGYSSRSEYPLICINQDRGGKESDRPMIKHAGVAPLLFLSALALAGDDGAAVNERIPVDRAELEAHWQVDCATAWTRLQAAAVRRPTQSHCGITPELVRDMKLCGFIYQAPGADSRHTCPDYRGVSQQLEKPGKLSDCPTLPASIANKMNCD
jgi:hypothetical protein